MKKILISFLSLSCFSVFAQTKMEITQTNPLSSILSYNMDYVSKSQQLLDFHHRYIKQLSPNNQSSSHLVLNDIRGVKVAFVSNIDMPILNSNFISFDNQKLEYIANTEQTNKIISQSCLNINNFLAQEQSKINSTIGNNLEITLNIHLKDGYKIHLNYVC